VLRDMPGEIIDERVIYLCPPNIRKGKIRHIRKIFDGIFYCSKYKIDTIISVQRTPHGYIGKLISFFTKKPYIHIAISGHRGFWKDGKIIEKLNLAVFKKSDMITVTGKQTQSYLIAHGFSPEKITILPNLPSSRFLEVNVSQYNNREYDIVSFSRIDKNKNLVLLLKAVARLKKTFNVKLIIAGDGDDLNRIKKFVGDLKIEDNVRFVGFITKLEDKIKIYSNSKIFVSCSKGEGFPVSLLEAMSCGCVPVVSNVGDIVDVIDQGINGYIFNNTDKEEELVSYLQLLLNDEKSAKEISENARQISQQISVDKNAKIWDGVFSKLYKRN